MAVETRTGIGVFNWAGDPWQWALIWAISVSGTRDLPLDFRRTHEKGPATSEAGCGDWRNIERNLGGDMIYFIQE